MTLEARLTRIEHLEGRVHPHRQYRFCRIVASDAEEEAVRQDVMNQGYDPDWDLFLIRLVPVYPAESMTPEVVATDGQSSPSTVGQAGDKAAGAGKPRRYIQITANQGDEDEAQRLLAAEGDNPDGEDLVIVRVIVAAPGQTLNPRSPRIIAGASRPDSQK